MFMPILLAISKRELNRQRQGEVIIPLSQSRLKRWHTSCAALPVIFALSDG
jgi:hypothetical protein